MLAGDDLGDRLGLHPLERLDALAALAAGYPVEQHVGFLLAHGLSQHAAYEVRRPRSDVRSAVRDADEVIEHRGHLLAGDLLELGHRDAELLHLACVELLEHIRRVLLAQAHEQNRGALRTCEISRFASHRWRPNPSRPARPASDPARPTCGLPRSAAQNWV